MSSAFEIFVEPGKWRQSPFEVELDKFALSTGRVVIPSPWQYTPGAYYQGREVTLGGQSGNDQELWDWCSQLLGGNNVVAFKSGVWDSQVSKPPLAAGHVVHVNDMHQHTFTGGVVVDRLGGNVFEVLTAPHNSKVTIDLGKGDYSLITVGLTTIPLNFLHVLMLGF